MRIRRERAKNGAKTPVSENEVFVLSSLPDFGEILGTCEIQNFPGLGWKFKPPTRGFLLFWASLSPKNQVD